jgi:bacillaene synthase trans-acting acyltransferase
MPAGETVFMFSGQGSQYFQMGKELFENDDTFRGWMLRLDETARQAAGRSVVETLYSAQHGKSEPFDRTLLSHPAILMVEYSLAQSLIHAGVRPDMVLGVSVGSFAAAAVAGFIDVEDALSAVIRQAMALEEWGEPGGMTAVLADPALFTEHDFSDRGELAAVNFSSHFVVSAKRSELVAIEAVLKRQEVAHQRLPVSFPFHSQWMDKAQAPFETFMRSIRCRPGRMPLVCCDRTMAVSEVNGAFFWDVVRHPIRFRETIAGLEQRGARRYVDAGPAGTLATFLKYGLPPGTTSTVHTILTPFGRDRQNLAAVASSIGH